MRSVRIQSIVQLECLFLDVLDLDLNLRALVRDSGRHDHNVKSIPAPGRLALAARQGERCGRQLLLQAGVPGSEAPEADAADQPRAGPRLLLGFQELRVRDGW